MEGLAKYSISKGKNIQTREKLDEKKILNNFEQLTA